MAIYESCCNRDRDVLVARAKFDEVLAKRSFAREGFFSVHAKTGDPLARTPIAVP